jgi:hypothetical protein
MAFGEEGTQMPPPSTQNLNAKLSNRRDAEPQPAGGGLIWKALATPLQGSTPPVRIVGAASSYRGGYRVDN